MATLIGLKKEEKLALLKIMIDISDHYRGKLPEAYTFIQETTSHFNLPDGVSEAYFMLTSDAKKVLSKCFKNKNKECFCSQLLSFMLKTPKLEDIYERFINLQNGRNENERNKDKARLISIFRQEWVYAFNLTRGIFENYQLAYTNVDPFKSDKYTFIAVTNPKQTPLSASKLNTHLDKDIQIVKDIIKISDTDTGAIGDNSNKQGLYEIYEEIKGKIHKYIQEELRKEREEMKKALGRELKEEIIKELKEIQRKEIRNELHSGMKSFVNENFNETLYKDL